MTPDRLLAIAAAPSQLWPTQKTKLYCITPLQAHFLKAQQENNHAVASVYHNYQDPCFCPEWHGRAWPLSPSPLVPPSPLATPMATRFLVRV